MSSESPVQARASLIPGIAIIAGTAVGAGMFSLPLISAGMWFSWSLLLLVFTWFCLLHTGLLILESNLNFPVGSSFDTLVRETLGPRWNTLNGFALAFVLYILTYAYISGGGSMVSNTLQAAFGITAPRIMASLLFALLLAAIVWFSTALVGRIAAILIGGMIITFVLSIGGLSVRVQWPVLLDNQLAYAPFLLVALPYYLTSFGFHGNVPSLMKYYGKDPRSIRKCLLYGSLLSLVAYILWLGVSMGNLSRVQIRQVIEAGGNIGDLVSALSGVSNSDGLEKLLNVFANMAVVSSFLGVSLGLFDYLADRFKFDNSRRGRFNTALLTFAPPTVAGLCFPDGFLYAIGLAGLCGCIWGVIVPALCARASREKFGSPRYRVWGGSGLIYLLLSYGALLIICYLLAAIDMLPVFGTG